MIGVVLPQRWQRGGRLPMKVSLADARAANLAILEVSSEPRMAHAGGSERPRCGMLRRDRRVQAARVLSIVGIVVLTLRNRRRGNRMSDPGRQGPTTDTAPKVRGKRFREHIARLLADMVGRLEDSYADSKQQLDIRTKELSEALQRETATSQVLGIISSSPTDLEPVFETILANATRLCEASYGNLWLCEGDAIRLVALHGAMPAAYAAERRRGAMFRRGAAAPITRATKIRQPVHVADLRAEQPYLDRDPFVVTAVELGGIRTLLQVPMLEQNEVVGVISIYRREVRPFTEKQVALVTSFASQAVIAIENARLLNELRESLEQQTATSEVLSVISSSPGELKPVFETMLGNAIRLCEAQFGILYRYDGDVFHADGLYNVAPAFADYLSREPPRPDPRNSLGRVLQTKQPVHIPDVTAEPAYAERERLRATAVKVAGFRTLLTVPMLKEGNLLGAITIYRKEVRPFTDKQIALVTNFASQAVIAIENAR